MARTIRFFSDSPWTQRDTQTLRAFYTNEIPPAEIARMLGRPEEEVRQRTRMLGLEMPRIHVLAR
ncbi:hypothetical protein H9L12_01690 [Sphingomonas rhizophila]|jgi:hypothetical protein|uniref:AsnC family protein n=1 Tax=Sphingomonas rhizophila TaxID=2071607 RepID=A0A7G9SBZ6_9SPHN|nr:hypothetical protein [Sphingomonas rhizophila]QNN65371.1 hypothetical protein H9L12_01690 [Sphingomonas rhizophila]